jgi:hypothetical protein
LPHKALSVSDTGWDGDAATIGDNHQLKREDDIGEAHDRLHRLLPRSVVYPEMAGFTFTGLPSTPGVVDTDSEPRITSRR